MAECIHPIRIARQKSSFCPSGFIYVPCGKCLPCLSMKRRDWSFRISEEFKICESAHFLTLTYNDENLPWGLEPSLCKRDVQLFLKRLRKAISKLKLDGWPKLRYFICGEYGPKLGGLIIMEYFLICLK